jgi:D-beta-D-heptose 7-phosphate kinase/D-beta-D-heptose 1-phosphate adenosyltransferase
MQLPDFSTARVLVAGDLMLDRYWHGATSRISPEAPVPVVHVKQSEERAGGAGNVALNIAALGAQATLLGFTGDDDAAGTLTELLQRSGVNCITEKLPELATISKLRVMSRHQQLIRLDFEDGFHLADSARLLQSFEREVQRADVVVLSDYGKGTLHAIEKLIEIANKANKPVLIDPKGTDFDKYRNATLMTPNLSEFEAVAGLCADEQQTVNKGMQLLRHINLQALLITRGEHGMTLLTRNDEPLHLPTHALEVFDVTGAGDTVISVLAAGLAARLSLPEATALANVGAGIVVGKIGTATVSRDEFSYALRRQRAQHRGVIGLEDLLETLQNARMDGEKIVATNGCFDILHPGHVRYLQQAKTLGDRLIVLVNSDASVQRLKGPERPVNRLEQRMEMLAALECVDWVVAFDDDTPRDMIGRILPDILVKGGDYSDITTIAGHEHVLANGGEVKILPFVAGHSTTGIIETIKGKAVD